MNGKSAVPPVDLIEEATSLLRQAPASAWAAYGIGGIPFALAFLFYWADMSRSPDAPAHLLEASLGVTVTYIWMCCWQAVFMQALAASRTGRPPAPWTAALIRRLILVQGTWQPSALLLLPVAALIAAPFGWVYAFYQNLSLSEETPREAARRARRQAMQWPAQNHVVLAALSFFAFFVFLNLLVLTLLWPAIVQMFTGVENPGDSAMNRLNSTTFAVVALVTYLCVDPLAKACYVLRCFYGEAQHSGADLRAALSRLTRVAVLALLLLTTRAVSAQTPPPPPVSTQQLDRTLDAVIHRREFVWRLPRTAVESGQQGKVGNFFTQVGRSITTAIYRALRWIGNWIRELFDSFNPPLPQSGQLGAAPSRRLQGLLALLSVIFAAVLVAVWRRRNRAGTVVATAVAAQASVDLNAADLTADQLPESGWLSLAQEWIDKHDLRMALRALYLASLASLAHRELIAIHPAKSNFDYAAELRRRARGAPALGQMFQQNLRVFERSWYGQHAVTPDILAEFRSNVDCLRSYALS